MLPLSRLFFADHLYKQAVQLLFEVGQAAAKAVHFSINAAVLGAVSKERIFRIGIGDPGQLPVKGTQPSFNLADFRPDGAHELVKGFPHFEGLLAGKRVGEESLHRFFQITDLVLPVIDHGHPIVVIAMELLEIERPDRLVYLGNCCIHSLGSLGAYGHLNIRVYSKKGNICVYIFCWPFCFIPALAPVCPFYIVWLKQ